MSIIATALKHLIAAGVSGDDLVRAIADIEASIPAPVDEVAERRRAYDRERKRKAKADNSGGIPVESAESAESAESLPSFEVSPQTPLPKSNPGITPLTPHGGRISVVDFQILEIAVGVMIAGLDDLIANSLTPEHVLEAWNDLAERCNLPKAKMNPRRRRAIDARIRQHSVGDFTEAIQCIARNPWMHGDNDRGWRADFDFFLQPKSFTRLTEGGYDRASQTH
ncbi:hypothetical protein FJY63_00875 [Candidatus Sumerlaeota bacterium]|nr:hypothetical protein [Candidatus Sumerlaeota bacterium]